MVGEMATKVQKSLSSNTMLDMHILRALFVGRTSSYYG